MKRSKGITLIVLIITIIVVIILAAVVILTLSKNNPIESSKEARFKEDVRTFQDELALYISKQYTNAGGHWDGNISATTHDEIKNYIPSFTKKYEGKFIINNNNLEYTNELDEKEKEYAQILNVKEKPKQKLLPNEYQQVEYIESIGTQYINTKYIPNNKTNAEYKAKVKQFKMYGPHLLSTSGFYFPYYRLFGNGQLNVNRGGRETAIKFEIKKDVIYEYKYWNKKVYINGDEKATIDIGNDNTNNPLCIFTYGGAPNDAGCLGKMEFYYCRIYNEDTIVRNFIPCYSTKEVLDVNNKECAIGTKGMYDTVEGKFYTNQGTGEFIAGPDVNE